MADDDGTLLDNLCEALGGAGYEVVGCDSGSEALERILAWGPSIAVLDHYMPGLDGRTVCARVRALGLPVRIVLLTSACSTDDKVTALDAGADDYIVKPFELAELLARLRVQMRSAVRVDDFVGLERALGDRHADVREAARRAMRGSAGAGVAFRVLGDLGVEWRGRELAGVLWDRRQPRTILKLLLVRYGRGVSSEALIDVLWPDLPLEAARSRLHTAIRRTREALRDLGPERITRVEGGYALHLLPEDSLDLARMDDLLKALEHDPVDPLSLLSELCALYRGDLLADDLYAEWVVEERRRLRAAFTQAVEKGAARLASSSAEAALPLLMRLLDLEPSNEDLVVRIAELFLELGNGASAASVLARGVQALDDLGITPGPRLEHLRARLG